MELECAKEKHESVYTFILSRNDWNIRFNFWTSIISNISVSIRQAEDVHDGNRTENMASRMRKKASSCLARKETKFRKTRQLSKNDSVSLDHRLPLIQSDHTQYSCPSVTGLRAPCQPHSLAAHFNSNLALRSCSQYLDGQGTMMSPCLFATITSPKLPIHLCFPSSQDNSSSILKLRSNLFTPENIFDTFFYFLPFYPIQNPSYVILQNPVHVLQYILS